MREARLYSDLPEKFARLYDHRIDRFETPLDEWGIADVDDVFELAIRTFPYKLPAFKDTETDHHHLYWTEDWWKRYASDQDNIEDAKTVWTFRNSAPQVAYVPLPIHKWIEISQIPPPPPSLEVMRKRNAAWQGAALLLNSAASLDKARDKYDKNKGIPRRVLTSIPGLTSKDSRLSDQPLVYVEIIDDAWWLSELQGRVQGWKHIAQTRGHLPTEHGILHTSRLSDVRTLSRKLNKNNKAYIPQLPDGLVA